MVRVDSGSLYRRTQPKLSGSVLGRRPLGAFPHSSNEPGELSRWLCHDDSIINMVLELLIITIIITERKHVEHKFYSGNCTHAFFRSVSHNLGGHTAIFNATVVSHNDDDDIVQDTPDADPERQPTVADSAYRREVCMTADRVNVALVRVDIRACVPRALTQRRPPGTSVPFAALILCQCFVCSAETHYVFQRAD